MDDVLRFPRMMLQGCCSEADSTNGSRAAGTKLALRSTGDRREYECKGDDDSGSWIHSVPSRSLDLKDESGLGSHWFEDGNMGDSDGVEFPDAIDARLESNDARRDFCALSLSNSLMIDSCSDLRRRGMSPTIPFFWISARSSCVVQWGNAEFAEEHAPPIAPMSLAYFLPLWLLSLERL